MVNYNRMFKPSNSKASFSRPEGAGNFDNMDDYNIVQSIQAKQAWIQEIPQNRILFTGDKGRVLSSDKITWNETTFNINGDINVAEGNYYRYGSEKFMSAKQTDQDYLDTLFVGYDAGISSTGNRITAIGARAGTSNSGSRNICLGTYAGSSCSGSDQIAIGYASGQQNSGNAQIAIGAYSGISNSGGSTTGVGYGTLRENTGSRATGIGYYSGNKNKANNLTAIGHYTAANNTGHYLTAIGTYAGQDNSGDNCVFIGYQAGKDNTTDNQFQLIQTHINTTPLIKGNFSTGNVDIYSLDVGGSTNYTEIKADGEINLHGTARVLKQIQIPLGAIQALGTNPPTLVEKGLNGAYEYSASVAEKSSTVVQIRYDQDISVAPKLQIAWSSPATTGVCRWKLEYLYRGVGEDLSSTTPDGTLYIDASPDDTTANGMVITEFTLGTPASTDKGLWLRLTRDATHANDTMTEKAYTYGGAIIYTSNKLGTAL